MTRPELPFFDYEGVDEENAKIDAEAPDSFELVFVDDSDVYSAGRFDWKTRPDAAMLSDGRVALMVYEPGRDSPVEVHIRKPATARLVDSPEELAAIRASKRSVGMAGVIVTRQRRKEYKCPACAHEWRGHPRTETMQEVFDDDRRDEALDGDRFVVAGLLNRAIRARGLCTARIDNGARIRVFGADVKTLAVNPDDYGKIPHVWEIDLRHELPRAYVTLARLGALPNEYGPLDTFAVIREDLLDSLAMAAKNYNLTATVECDGATLTIVEPIEMYDGSSLPISGARVAWRVDVSTESVRACRALLRLSKLPRYCGPAKAFAALKAE